MRRRLNEKVKQEAMLEQVSRQSIKSNKKPEDKSDKNSNS